MIHKLLLYFFLLLLFAIIIGYYHQPIYNQPTLYARSLFPWDKWSLVMISATNGWNLANKKGTHWQPHVEYFETHGIRYII